MLKHKILRVEEKNRDFARKQGEEDFIMKNIYNFATKEELDLIHEYSMKLLEENGVEFICDQVMEIFNAHGFRTEGKKVFMGEKDVMKALKTAPKSYDWYGRNSYVTVGGGKSILAPCYGPPHILEDGEFHVPEKRDFLNFTKLQATSKVLDVSNPNVMAIPFLPPNVASNWAMATVLMLDERPAIGMVDGRQSAIDSIKMTQDFYGIYDKTVVSGLINIASPGRYTEHMCESLIEYAKAGQAVFITPSAMNGLTAPFTIASLLLLNNAEILAGIVLAQLINPGTPVIYGNQSHGSDLRYAAPTVGSPEQCLIFSAVKAFGDYYGLPVRTGGSSCDAKQVDMQAGMEAFSTMYATLHSGADMVIHACGGMDSDGTLSYDKFIYDEEIILSVQRILRGIEVTEDTLCYDEIVKVGPGGNFLSESTGKSMKRYRSDYATLQIPNRVSHAVWLSKGSETITQRTKAIYQKRLEEYCMPELDNERRKILEKYVAKELLD